MLMAGCSGAEGDDYPALVPTALILAEPDLPDAAPATPAEQVADTADLDGRAAALRNRADTLRGPVLTEPERRAMTP